MTLRRSHKSLRTPYSVTSLLPSDCLPRPLALCRPVSPRFGPIPRGNANSNSSPRIFSLSRSTAAYRNENSSPLRDLSPHTRPQSLPRVMKEPTSPSPTYIYQLISVNGKVRTCSDSLRRNHRAPPDGRTVLYSTKVT
uniref:Uncharacterized protein n=1 Tax=Knipowitschia caucasica TaxID=637954 RepID=A0AAV2LEL7_KNICA